MSLVSIKTAIQNKLDACAYIDVVYGYETGKESGHSYATVTKARFESKFLDNKRNENNWFFTIRLHTERSANGFGVSTAETISDTMVDEVITAFHMDTTLSGTCKYIEPIDADFSYAEGPESVRVAEITLKAVEVFDTGTGTIT
jgi:hypothetical protein